jgi:hypothetical protein
MHYQYYFLANVYLLMKHAVMAIATPGAASNGNNFTGDMTACRY